MPGSGGSGGRNGTLPAKLHEYSDGDLENRGRLGIWAELAADPPAENHLVRSGLGPSAAEWALFLDWGDRGPRPPLEKGRFAKRSQGRKGNRRRPASSGRGRRDSHPQMGGCSMDLLSRGSFLG